MREDNLRQWVVNRIQAFYKRRQAKKAYIVLLLRERKKNDVATRIQVRRRARVGWLPLGASRRRWSAHHTPCLAVVVQTRFRMKVARRRAERLREDAWKRKCHESATLIQVCHAATVLSPAHPRPPLALLMCVGPAGGDRLPENLPWQTCAGHDAHGPRGAHAVLPSLHGGCETHPAALPRPARAEDLQTGSGSRGGAGEEEGGSDGIAHGRCRCRVGLAPCARAPCGCSPRRAPHGLHACSALHEASSAASRPSASASGWPTSTSGRSGPPRLCSATCVALPRGESCRCVGRRSVDGLSVPRGCCSARV